MPTWWLFVAPAPPPAHAAARTEGARRRASAAIEKSAERRATEREKRAWGPSHLFVEEAERGEGGGGAGDGRRRGVGVVEAAVAVAGVVGRLLVRPGVRRHVPAVPAELEAEVGAVVVVARPTVRARLPEARGAAPLEGDGGGHVLLVSEDVGEQEARLVVCGREKGKNLS